MELIKRESNRSTATAVCTEGRLPTVARSHTSDATPETWTSPMKCPSKSSCNSPATSHAGKKNLGHAARLFDSFIQHCYWYIKTLWNTGGVGRQRKKTHEEYTICIIIKRISLYWSALCKEATLSTGRLNVAGRPYVRYVAWWSLRQWAFSQCLYAYMNSLHFPTRSMTM